MKIQSVLDFSLNGNELNFLFKITHSYNYLINLNVSQNHRSLCFRITDNESLQQN